MSSFLLMIVAVSLGSVAGGCAPLPDVSTTIREAPADDRPPQMLSAKAPLSLKERELVMERLKSSTEPTDVVQRYTTVIESVSETPLTKGNRITLLVDGPATYAAMFRAIEKARDHVNIETFTMEDIDDAAGLPVTGKVSMMSGVAVLRSCAHSGTTRSRERAPAEGGLSLLCRVHHSRPGVAVKDHLESENASTADGGATDLSWLVRPDRERDLAAVRRRSSHDGICQNVNGQWP